MGKSCLLVDDSAIVRKVARRMLEPMGFDVSEAVDGVKAAEFCRGQMPEFILLDWHMPEMDGLSFLKVLRAMEGGGAPVVIFCTTETDFSHIQEAIMAGANEYVMKPFDSDILHGKLVQVGLLPP